MEIKFRTNINEYIDLFMYGRLCEKNWNKEVRIRKVFVFITIMIFVQFEGKFYNIAYYKTSNFSVLMGFLFVIITPTIYRFANRRNIKNNLKKILII